MKIIGLSIIFLISSEFRSACFAGIFSRLNLRPKTREENPNYCEKRVSIDNVEVCWLKYSTLKKVRQLASAPNITELNWIPDSSSKISVIREKSFSSLKHLQKLRLTGHGIIYIQPNSFKGLTELTMLNLNNNNISTESNMFAGLPKLELLCLDGAFNNYQTELSVGFFDNLPQLTQLFLEENYFEEIPMGVFENLQSLKSLWLYSNNIHTITPGAFGRLRLEVLDITGNKIKVIETNTFNGLSADILSLKINSIETIEPGAFNGLEMKVLDLDNNQLKTIGPNDFDGLHAGKLLLGWNERELTIAQGAFKNASLEELILSYDLLQSRMNFTEIGLPNSTIISIY